MSDPDVYIRKTQVVLLFVASSLLAPQLHNLKCVCTDITIYKFYQKTKPVLYQVTYYKLEYPVLHNILDCDPSTCKGSEVVLPCL